MRIWTLEEIYERWPGTGFRIAFEGTLPTLAAVVWGIKTYINTDLFFSGLTAAGVAFTLVLYVQGQVLRVAKSVRDERDTDEFRNSFLTLQQSLEEIRKQRFVALAPQDPGDRLAEEERGKLARVGNAQQHVSDTASLFGQAESAFQNDLFYSSAIVAAIAFEQGLRQTAMLLQLKTRWPLTAIIKELTERFENPGLSKRFGTLLRTRNRLVHPPEFSAQNLEKYEARELIDAFKSGNELLEALPHKWHPVRTSGIGSYWNTDA